MDVILPWPLHNYVASVAEKWLPYNNFPFHKLNDCSFHCTRKDWGGGQMVSWCKANKPYIYLQFMSMKMVYNRTVLHIYLHLGQHHIYEL